MTHLQYQYQSTVRKYFDLTQSFLLMCFENYKYLALIRNQ